MTGRVAFLTSSARQTKIYSPAGHWKLKKFYEDPLDSPYIAAFISILNDRVTITINYVDDRTGFKKFNSH